MDREELLKIAKPILFNTEMVQAILDGRKTVTRRIWKDWNKYAVPDMSLYDADKKTYAVHTFEDQEHKKKISMIERRCPICPGDILYVRETWCKNPNYKEYYFKTRTEQGIAPYELKWKPSIHMPKEAARIFLKVKDVRVERLQEITPAQADQEGVGDLFYEEIGYDDKNYGNPVDEKYGIAKEQFAWLWNSTIKKSELDIYGWDANPYVWVIEFERIEV